MFWRYQPLARTVSCTIGVYDSGFTNDANAAAFAVYTSLTGAGSPGAATQMTTDWLFTGVQSLLTTTAGLQVAGSHLATTTGTIASTSAVPIYTPAVVSKLTGLAGKKYRGRMYVPIMLGNETAVDAGGSLGTPLQTQIQTTWNVFLLSQNASSFPARLLHDTTTTGVLGPNPITSLLCRPVTGIQRRRRSRGA